MYRPRSGPDVSTRLQCYRFHVPAATRCTPILFGRRSPASIDGARNPYGNHLGQGARLSPVELPEDVQAACLQLAADLELAFAGIDLRMTPKREFYCFEVNPSPAYSYYETSTGQPISKALDRSLTRLNLPLRAGFRYSPRMRSGSTGTREAGSAAVGPAFYGSGVRCKKLIHGLNPFPRGACHASFPAFHRALINTEPRSHPLARETQLPSLGYEVLSQRPRGWIRVVAKEADNPREEADWWLSLPVLPVEDRAVVYPEPHCNVFLEKPQIQPPLLEVVT